MAPPPIRVSISHSIELTIVTLSDILEKITKERGRRCNRRQEENGEEKNELMVEEKMMWV